MTDKEIEVFKEALEYLIKQRMIVQMEKKHD